MISWAQRCTNGTMVAPGGSIAAREAAHEAFGPRPCVVRISPTASARALRRRVSRAIGRHVSDDGSWRSATVARTAVHGGAAPRVRRRLRCRSGGTFLGGFAVADGPRLHGRGRAPILAGRASSIPRAYDRA